MTAEVRIRVKEGTEGPVQDLSIALSASVPMLKEKLALIYSRPTRGLIVLFGDEALPDNKTLEDCHISANTLLTVEFRQASLRIPTTDAQGYAVVVKAEVDWSVQTLKDYASAQLHTPLLEIHLMDDFGEVTDGSKLVRDLQEPKLAVTRRAAGGDSLDSSSR